MTEADPLPERLEIAPRSSIDAQLRPPGSKSITNRALVLAALACGDSRLLGPLDSDDTRVMVQCLVALGVPITTGANGWSVAGRDGRLDRSPTALHTGNSGTTARFLTAACALVEGNVVIDGSERMRQRPISDLVDALQQLGVHIDSLGEGGCPPLRVRGGALRGGRAVIDGSRSSQYVSGVLMVAPHAQQDVELSFLNGVLVSRPYVELTLQMMRAFGVAADWTSEGGLEVKSGQHYTGREYSIEPDASAAVYPFCAAAITGGLVRVLGASQILLGDRQLLPADVGNRSRQEHEETRRRFLSRQGLDPSSLIRLDGRRHDDVPGLDLKGVGGVRVEAPPVVGNGVDFRTDLFPDHRVQIQNEGGPPVRFGHRMKLLGRNDVAGGQAVPQADERDQERDPSGHVCSPVTDGSSGRRPRCFRTKAAMRLSVSAPT